MHADSRLLIIAEAGVNHNGDLGRARDMVSAAAEAGADYVKFQAFDAAELIAPGTATAGYQQSNTGEADQIALVKPLELSRDDFSDLAELCAKRGVKFLATPFDIEFTADLVGLGMDRLKIASGELTNDPALIHFASFGLPILMSTGMATMGEVAHAVDVLREAGARDVTLLHCTSLYPAPDQTLNLRALPTMADAFGLPVGYSDHSLGDHAAIAAVALGATVIEKHFTLDKSLPGPDHAASLEPDELKTMIDKLRTIEIMLGDGQKRPARGEPETAALVRRSWHAARDLSAGTLLVEDDLVLKRPANGLAPKERLVGRRLRVPLSADEPIRATDLSSV